MAKQRIKVVVAITEDWFAHSHFRPLLRILADRFTDVVLFTHVAQHRAPLEETGVRVEHFDFDRGGSHLNAPIVRSRFARALAAEQPDVVHSVSTRLVGLAVSLPVGDYTHVFHVTGLGALFTSNKLRHRATRPYFLFKMRQHISKARGVLLVENAEDRDLFCSCNVADRTSSFVVPGAGIDLSDIPMPPTTWPEERPVRCVYAGRMIADKGIEVLIDAVAIARAHFDIKLDLFGSVDMGNPNPLPKAQLQDWEHKHDWLKYHGHVADQAVIWSPAGIAVQPTLAREGLPRSGLEAAAYGNALIVSDIPGCRDLVLDDTVGLRFPAGDAQALAERLVETLSNPAKTAARISKMRTRVAEEFSVSNVRSMIGKAYDQVLAEA